LKEQRDINSKVSLWWRDLRKVWRSEEWGGKFEDRLSLEVGNGREVMFWSDNWIDSEDLKSIFPRLFSLSVNKEAKLCDCGIWGNRSWKWKLRWRRGLFAWEEEQESQLLELISNKMLEMETMDRWVWKDSESTEFSVKSAYGFLRGEGSEEVSKRYNFLWKIKVLPSAHVTSWRVMKNKVACKVNLERRGIEIESNLCCLCRRSEESTNNLFCECRVAWLI